MKGPLSRRAVEHHLDHLTEELSPKQLERLHSLAAAIGDDGHIPLNQALELATPGGDAVTAQASFRKFRQALRDAAVENRVDLELVSDNQKKAPEHRSCWFVGADTTVIGLAAMSQDAARMTRDTPIEAMAAEVIEKGPVVVYVSTARNPADTRIRKLEQEFVDKLRQRCAVRGDYAYDVVCADDSPLGREISAERERRRESADVVVALVSCAYLSDSGGDEEWVNSGRGRPLVLQALMQLPPPPLKTRLPLAEMHQRHKPFELCRGPERDTFVDECLSAIAARLSGQVGAPVSRHDGRMLDDWAKGTVDRRKAAEYTVVAMAQETDLRSPELGTARTRVLGQQTPAVDRLVRWATDDAAPPLCALLGDLGMGKTTTTRLFTEQLLARREQDPRVPLPILFDLRDLSIEVLREGPNLRRIVTALLEASEAVERRPSADELLDQVAEGGCVLIFDGLDEVLVHLEPADGQRFTHAMWRATEDTWRSGRRRGRPSRLLLSCRTHYFRSIRDEASHLTGQHRDGPVAESYLALLMLPFGDQQVRDYLRANVLGADVDALLKVIDDVHNLREIASRPLTLRMITEQLEAIERAKLAGREVRAVDLYGLFVEQWLDRDNGKHVLIPHHKQLLMEHLAARQWRSGVRGWTVDDVEQWLVDFLAARPDLERHYSERTPNLWKEDLRTATFLVRRNDDTFAFAHTSMQEFFLARYLFKALNSADLDAWQGPVPSRETLDFLGQLLAGLAPENQRAAVAGLAAQAALPGPSAVLTFAYALAAAKAGYPHHELNGSRLDDADLRDWEIGGGSRLVLHDAVFARANLTGAVFRDADLSGAVFDGADLTRAELHDSELRDAFLRDARVVGTILRSCDLTGARWDGAAIYRAQALWCRPAAPTDSPDWLVAPTDTAPAANARLTTLAGHTDALTSGAFSPDGTRILTTSHDHTARIWDTATGEPLLTLTNHTSGLTCGTFSPDGTRILTTGNDNTARIWDTATGETLLTLNGHTSGLTCGTFSPDGTRILTTSNDHTARIWDTTTGKTLLTLNGHTDAVTGGAFSPDGTRILTTSNDHTARIWDTTTGKTLLTLTNHTSGLTCGTFSPDGTRILTTGYDNSARIWDTATGETLLTLNGHTSGLTCGTFSPDGTRILTTGYNTSARIWDTATGKTLLTLTSHTDAVTGGAFSPDGTRILTTGYNTSARIWDTATGETLLTLNGHTSGLTCGTFSPDGTRILTTGYNTSARIWDTATGETLLTLNGHTSSLTCGTFSPDGTRILTTSNDHTARIWDTTTGKTLLTLNGHTDAVTGGAFSPDGTRILTTGYDGTARIWDAATGETLLTLTGHTDAVTGGAFSPDGTRILTTGYDCTARIWDTTTGEPCDWMLEQFPRGHTVVWSAPDKRLLSASSEAWRWLGWLVPVDGKLVRLPAETYGPLPSEVVHGSTGAL